MSRVLLLLNVILSTATPAVAEGPPTPAGGDFKVLIAGYGLAKEPVYTEELVVISGRIYQFLSKTHEVVIIEPSKSRVDLLDLDRRIQAEVTFDQVDEGVARVSKRLAGEVETRAKSAKRADRVEGEMTRDLAEPRLSVLEEPGKGRLRMTNATVEVDAAGEPEPDPSRLSQIRLALTTVVKLGAFRVPDDLPPFVELEAIAALTGERKWRPSEITYLYRLAGPPRKFRRTYRLAPGVTERDREAIRRVDRFRESARSVRYEKYRTDR